LLRSSLEQKHKDREIAEFLKTQKLTFALDDKLIEEFIGMGAGPRTLEALGKMKVESRGLPEPETAESIPEMDWLKYDEVKTRVSYVDQHENYELVSVNNKVTNQGLDDLGGATSTGEFGSILAEIFSPTTAAEFRWARHALLRGRGVWVFSLRVPQSRSRWRLNYQKQREITAGYTGLVYVDKETERVIRVVIEAQDVPRDFPIQDARTRLDYDFIEIGGSNFLLPLKARVFMRDGRFLSRNDVEFRLYRKFSAEASISFDEIDELAPLPDDEPAPGEPVKQPSAPEPPPPAGR
jgi:hypothetical protein